MSDSIQERRGPGRPSTMEVMARTAGSSIVGDHNQNGEDLARRKLARKPFGSFTQKLAYADRPGYHRHWFNDAEARLDEAKEAGYTHVEKDGKPVKKVAGIAREGGALFAYLMEIPEEWWKEDLLLPQKVADETDKAIRAGEFIPAKSSEDSKNRFYPTAQGRKIDIKDRKTS